MFGRESDAAKKRRLSQQDFDGFIESIQKQPSQRTKAGVIAALERKNSYRMWRLRRDYRWMQRQIKKMGMNPDEAWEFLS